MLVIMMTMTIMIMMIIKAKNQLKKVEDNNKHVKGYVKRCNNYN